MFQIFVDSASNLPAVIAKQYNINVISFINRIDGKEVTCYNPELSLEEERQKGTEYYNAMRKGCEIKTGLISTATFEEKFQKAFDADQDVLYLSLSKNISRKIGCGVNKNLKHGIFDPFCDILSETDANAYSTGTGMDADTGRNRFFFGFFHNDRLLKY